MKTSTYRQAVPSVAPVFKSEETARIAKAAAYQSKCVAKWAQSK